MKNYIAEFSNETPTKNGRVYPNSGWKEVHDRLQNGEKIFVCMSEPPHTDFEVDRIVGEVETVFVNANKKAVAIFRLLPTKFVNDSELNIEKMYLVPCGDAEVAEVKGKKKVRKIMNYNLFFFDIQKTTSFKRVSKIKEHD